MDDETKKAIAEIKSQLKELSDSISVLMDDFKAKSKQTYPFSDPPNPSIRFISVHHSASRADVSRSDVMAWHEANGWSAENSGYHVFIKADGNIEWGAMDATLKYTVGHQNPHTLAVCLAGNFHPNHPGYTGAPTPAQIASLRQVLAIWKDRYMSADVVPHRFFGGTVCPGDDLATWLEDNYVS
jgi:hypothetical protein